jgi:hypothetical protein
MKETITYVLLMLSIFDSTQTKNDTTKLADVIMIYKVSMWNHYHFK